MSGAQGPNVDELAADLIAADVAKTQMAGRPAKTTATPFIVAEQQGPRWLVIGGLGVVLVVVLAGGAFALGFLGGGAASATPTPVAVATATPAATLTPTPSPTPSPTPAPTPAPTPSPSPSPVPSPSVTPPALLAVPVGNAITDSGVAVPDDGVVDISGVSISQAADGSVDAFISFVAPMPPGTNSRYVAVIVGTATEGRSGAIVAAQTQYLSERGWFWQLHAGELTSGSFDERSAPLSSAAVIVHDLAAGTFRFQIPASEMPANMDWIYIVSYHQPEPGDERRADEFGALFLNELPVP